MLTWPRLAPSRRWRVLLPLILLILGCNPTQQPPPDRHYVTVFGHRAILTPGSAVELPILLRTVNTNHPVFGSRVDVRIGKSADDARSVFNGRTDVNGLVTAKFTAPTDLKDPDEFLIITSDQLFGQSAYSRPVYVGTAYNVLVSTDKPVYQPGQTLHMRVLALENVSLAAAAGQTVHVRLQDPNGAYLMDSPVVLSEWGIGSADFDLDSQAATGKYRVIASIGAREAGRTIEVKPYTLPRFKITLQPDRRYYDIGGAIAGEIRAEYFFGKPVAGGKVSIQGKPAGRDDRTVVSVAGQTGPDGAYRFSFPVPTYFFDELTSGSEDLNLTVVVTDTAGSAEDLQDSLLISADPLKLTAVPEGGFLHPGVENIIYLEVSEPDGTPFPAQLTVQAPSLGVTTTVQTDDFGLATMRLTPTSIEDLELHVIAAGANVHMDKPLKLGTIGRTTSVLVRPDRAEYHVGDQVNLNFLATGDVKTVYLDLVKDRQTLDFRTVDVSGGQAQASIGLDGHLLGTLEINVYAVGGDGTLTRDRRLVLVNPAPADVQVNVDAETYRPGDTAHVKMKVTLDGKPLSAALGVSIVDESVYAVGAIEPGFVRTYFLLQDELLDRRYGIKGFEPFGDNAPPPAPFEGIQVAAGTALMGALATELAAPAPVAAVPSIPATQPESRQPGLPWPLGDWTAKLALVLPLLGIALYDGRRSLRKGLFVLSVLAAGTLLWVSCSSSALPSAPAAQPQAALPNAEAAIGPVEVSTERQQTGVHVRQLFPETLLWLPEMVTDAQGVAEIPAPIADSITTWRVNVVASTKNGVLGSARAGLRVFQDFFIEPNVPQQLTQGDETEIAVSLFNYLDQPQTITLTVEGGDWMEAAHASQTVSLAPNDVSVARVPVRLLAPGLHTLQFSATGSRMGDAVRKQVLVTPNGRKVSTSQNGVLARSQEQPIPLPQDVLSGSEQITAKIYPSAASRFPLDLPETFSRDFCFYYDLRSIQPIALVAQYLKETGQLTPVQQLRTERLLQRGYQRLLRYYSYVSSGFTGECYLIFRPEPDVTASAAALVALHDLGQLVYVDPEITRMTLDYLASQQHPDGSWTSEHTYWNYELQSDKQVAVTAYVVWALGEAGLANSQVAKSGLAFVTQHMDGVNNAYTQALIANVQMLVDPDNAQARRLLDALVKQVDSNNRYGDANALVALAMVRSGRYLDETAAALAGMQGELSTANTYGYLSPPGQVNAIRALLLDARRTPDHPQGDITLALNDQDVATLAITPENGQVRQQAVFTAADAPLHAGDNTLRLRLRGVGTVNYTIDTQYYVPWAGQDEPTGPLALSVTYGSGDRLSAVKVGDAVQVTAVVAAQTATPTGQLIVDIATPAGFAALDADLAALRDQGLIKDYQIAGNRVLLVLDGLEPAQKVVLGYRLLVNTPGSVRIPPSRVYQVISPNSERESGSEQVLVATR